MPGTIDGGHMQRVLTLPGVVLFFYNYFVYSSGVRYRVTIADIDV